MTRANKRPEMRTLVRDYGVFRWTQGREGLCSNCRVIHSFSTLIDDCIFALVPYYHKDYGVRKRILELPHVPKLRRSIFGACVLSHLEVSKDCMDFVIVWGSFGTISIPKKRVDIVGLIDGPPAARSFLRPIYHLVPVATPSPLSHTRGASVLESHRPWCIVCGTNNFLAQGVETMQVMLPANIQRDAIP